AAPEPVTRHGQLRDLRRELNALVSAAHHRTGKPHGWIHNELRRLCGGPPIAAATTEQLRARIEAVRGLTA
ncbi:MAG TPA: RNA helicase, partial [Mycobacterium sp.]|nr:RNA helicase [Mycobacterium sp.]